MGASRARDETPGDDIVQIVREAFYRLNARRPADRLYVPDNEIVVAMAEALVDIRRGVQAEIDLDEVSDERREELLRPGEEEEKDTDYHGCDSDEPDEAPP